MYIKIGGFLPSEENHLKVLEIITSIVIEDYNQSKNYYLGNSSLLVDHKRGLIYFEGQTHPESIFPLVAELSKKNPDTKIFLATTLFDVIEHWTGSEEYDGQTFFGLFLNNKCSYFILNETLDQFEIPKLYEYYTYIDVEFDFIPQHFNEFVECDKVLELVKNKSIVSFGRFSSFGDFVRSDAFEGSSRNEFYRNLDSHLDENYIRVFEYYKWEYPYYDSCNEKYCNSSILEEEGEVLFYPLESFNSMFSNKSERKYTIVIDTETNGLPTDFNSEFPYLSFPEPVQISWIVFDEYDRIVQFRDYIIKPNGYTISEQSTKIHGVSEQIAKIKGENISVVVEELQDTLSKCQVLVGHNLEFDIKVLERASFKYENERGGCQFEGFITSMELKSYCTMKDSMSFLKESNISKYPKLSELYKHIFNQEPEGLHNSSKDIELTFNVYVWLRDNAKLTS
jgi:DNA polymerase III epsilon subunit-like protein